MFNGILTDISLFVSDALPSLRESRITSDLNQVMIKGRHKCAHDITFEKLRLHGTKEKRGTEEGTHLSRKKQKLYNVGLEGDRRGISWPGCELLEVTNP